MTDTINVAFRAGLPYHKQALAIGAAKALAQVKASMEGLPLAHIKVEGTDRCPACGCPVKDFDKVPCK